MLIIGQGFNYINNKVMRDVEAIENFTSQIFTTAITVITNMTISLVIVHNSEKGEDGLKHVPIDISFTAVG